MIQKLQAIYLMLYKR